MTKTAAVYCRISRDMGKVKGYEGEGVERQEELCRDLAARHDLEVVHVYTDNDISASSRSTKPRPQYLAMLEDARAGQFGAILAYSNSRLTRRPAEWEQLITLVENTGVQIRTVASGDTDFTTADGRAVARTIAAWDAAEAERTGERIAAQKAQAVKQGRFIGGPTPFGWRSERTAGTTGARPVIDPAEAEAIRRGYELVLTGHTVVSVADDWAARGVRSRSGKKLGTTQITRILLRVRNAGLVTHHGETVADNWPAIVTLEQHRQLEAILLDPARKPASENKRRYLLSGILLCHCGRKMTGYTDQNAGMAWYRCSIHQEGSRFVKGHSLRRMPPVDQYVTDLVATYLEGDQAAQWLGKHDDQQREHAQAPQHDRRQMRDLLDRKASLVRLFAQGAVTEAQLVEGTAEVQQQLSALEAAARRNTGSKVTARILAGDSPAQAFRDADVMEKREVIGALLSVQCVKDVPPGRFRPSNVSVTWKV